MFLQRHYDDISISLVGDWMTFPFLWQVIAAEGEHKASRALRHAAEVIAECPAALQVVLINDDNPDDILDEVIAENPAALQVVMMMITKTMITMTMTSLPRLLRSAQQLVLGLLQNT